MKTPRPISHNLQIAIGIFLINFLFSNSQQILTNSTTTLKIKSTRALIADHLSLIKGDSSPIFGNSSSLNYYFVDLYIGDPPQKQSLIIDTGSHITAVPCQPLCEKCGKHLNAYYDMRKSNNSQILACKSEGCDQTGWGVCNAKNECSYHISYVEQSSLTGVVIEDEVLFGDTFQQFKPVRMPIGCTQSENKLFFDQLADGIMGLSPHKGSFVNTLYKREVIPHNVFSLCFSQDGGYFSVGGLNTTLHVEPLQYLNFYGNSRYSIKLHSIEVDNSNFTVSDSQYQTIIDSGTTMTYLPSALYSQLENNIDTFCKKTNRCLGKTFTASIGLCFRLNENINHIQFAESMPAFTFHFENNVTYTLKPMSYLFNYTEFNNNDAEGDTFCTGIQSWKDTQILLGTTWMHNHDIVFDLQHNQIGFALANCAGSNVNVYKVPAEKVVIYRDKEDDHIVFTAVICALSVVVFVLLIALFRLRRGRKFLWMKVSSEDIQSEKPSMEIVNIEKNSIQNV